MTPQYANAQQFGKVILRMMPEWASGIPEGRLVAAILQQAWTDGESVPSRVFFSNQTGRLAMFCEKVGLNWEQVSEMYFNHCRGAK